MRRPAVASVAALVATVGLAVGATAQTADVGFGLQTFTMSEGSGSVVDQIQLATAPFGVAWAPHPRVTLDVRGAYAYGIATIVEGGYSEISGPTDTRVSVDLALGDLHATGLAILPTGDPGYTHDQLLMLGLAAGELLPLEVRAWGTGGGAGGVATYAKTLGRSSIALSAGYLAHGEYELFGATSPAYRSGGQVRITARAATRLGTGTVASVLGGHQRFSNDDYGGQELYRAGTRTEGFLSVTHAVGARESISLHAGYYVRSAGVIQAINPIVANDILPGIVASSGRELLVAGIEAHGARGRWAWVPSAEYRRLTTDDDLGSGWVASAGLAADYVVLGGRFGRRLTASASVRGHAGSSALSRDAEVSILGWDASLALRWRRGL